MAKRASKERANSKLAELKAKHFTPEGREKRVAEALKALETPAPAFILDRETWQWLAEDADLEDL